MLRSDFGIALVSGAPKSGALELVVSVLRVQTKNGTKSPKRKEK